MNEVLNRIELMGIVPVVKIEDAKNAVPLVRALKDGGLPVVEITFRTDAAQEAIGEITSKMPDVLVGAGTVLSVEQVKRAVEAGAKFIVSPGLNPEVVGYCVKNDIPITPGCSSPSDIEAALSFGLDVVKFFPAEASGGLSAIKAMSAPYGNVFFIPTGGINTKNITEYLSFNRILACGGSWMVKSDLIENGMFEEITRMTREAVGLMLGYDIAHVGINMHSEQAALEIASSFSSAFGFGIKNGNSSVFAGAGIEVNKSVGYGESGHIAIKTNSIKRAIFNLENRGFAVDMSTVKGSADKPVAVYLKNEIGGFAVHLLQKK